MELSSEEVLKAVSAILTIFFREDKDLYVQYMDHLIISLNITYPHKNFTHIKDQLLRYEEIVTFL